MKLNKKIIISGLAALIVVAGVGSYAYVKSSSSADQQNAAESDRLSTLNVKDTSVPSVDHLPDTQSQNAPSAGVYTDYSSAKVASAKGTKLLFFHAPWCNQCRKIEADINSNGIPNDVTVLKVDYDSNQELRQKYGVTLQTTFVKINDDGSLNKKFVAYNEPNFDSVKRNLLN